MFNFFLELLEEIGVDDTFAPATIGDVFELMDFSDFFVMFL